MKRFILPLVIFILSTPLLAQDKLEVPSIKYDGGPYITTDMEHDGVKIPSFTLRYDTNRRIALWVAYALNEGLIGKGTRGDDWLPDPNLDESKQAILYKGFRYGSGYDRGHQIPSADRLNPAANAQTFRFTNATPQLHVFNSGIWAELEKLVRTWAKRSDTLFVVTGCIPGSNTIADNVGNPVNIPSAYYKVALRRNTSKYGSVQWSACAVLLPHKEIPVLTWKENIVFLRQHSLTVNELETITGETFYPLLSTRISTGKVKEIKSSQSADWWWK